MNEATDVQRELNWAIVIKKQHCISKKTPSGKWFLDYRRQFPVFLTRDSITEHNWRIRSFRISGRLSLKKSKTYHSIVKPKKLSKEAHSVNTDLRKKHFGWSVSSKFSFSSFLLLGVFCLLACLDMSVCHTSKTRNHLYRPSVLLLNLQKMFQRFRNYGCIMTPFWASLNYKCCASNFGSSNSSLLELRRAAAAPLKKFGQRSFALLWG